MLILLQNQRQTVALCFDLLFSRDVEVWINASVLARRCRSVSPDAEHFSQLLTADRSRPLSGMSHIRG
ncbi:hypothetical protein NQZ68_033487 [Dissostichus eleginoides]|nr:hypothetical protein NQZ68_042027 [Dissostichus eleginoides]KAI9514369.1 hypothetical protein NQZ68_033487 [Dissostichus eleginoides]